jgi:DNA polymerase elongation subunit (family B)
MLNDLDLNKVLVLDIETVPQYPTYQSLPLDWQNLWEKKAQYLKKEERELASDIYSRAGIYAEFGKIICISVGVFRGSGTNTEFFVKSYYGPDEKQLLSEFSRMLIDKRNYIYLCGHNAKEFDFPYICRRMIINGLDLPPQLQISGKKPWEINHIDTMELWKFGDFKSYTSLELLANVFNIPTPKDDIDGSKVWQVYWQDKDLERIKNYCQKDVVTVAQILLKMKGESLIDSANITYK